MTTLAYMCVSNFLSLVSASLLVFGSGWEILYYFRRSLAYNSDGIEKLVGSVVINDEKSHHWW